MRDFLKKEENEKQHRLQHTLQTLNAPVQGGRKFQIKGSDNTERNQGEIQGKTEI